MPTHRIERIVPDSTALIDGILSEKLRQLDISTEAVVVSEAVMLWLEHQAQDNKAVGFLGITELETLRSLTSERGFRLEFTGTKIPARAVHEAEQAEMDALSRDLAFEQDATLFTSSKLQWRVASARGIPCHLVKAGKKRKPIALEGYFDATTMSVHLREGVTPMAKRGKPGSWTFDAVKPEPLTREVIQDISREIIAGAGLRSDGFVEIERPGSTIVQLGSYRIVITKPPFSDGWEITAVRPVRHMQMADYSLSEKLKQRITAQAEGILVAGAPGMGKSTFAQALAEHYAAQGKIVKTIEAPRDMVLPDTVTQYAISHGDGAEVHDVLLLSRPDYSVFDEMRNTDDFQLYADLRLAGIGLAGVVHAKNPVDAIQRFVGRIELGMIPQVVDTVIFIKDGGVDKVLSLAMTVKVPSGMTEADLARPVVVVSDFESGSIEYELYSYGEETVVVPVRPDAPKHATHTLAARSIAQHLQKYVSSARVEMTSDRGCNVYVAETEMPKLIGKGGETIKAIEQELGLHIEARAETMKATPGEPIPFEAKAGKKHVMIQVDPSNAEKMVSIFVGEDYLLSALVGKDGIIKLTTKHKIGRLLEEALHNGGRVRVELGGRS